MMMIFNLISCFLSVLLLNHEQFYVVTSFTSPSIILSRKNINYNNNNNNNINNSIHDSKLLMVSIGLGPEQKKDIEDEDRELIAGIDYEIPNHEEYRLSRRSKLDELCDNWYEKLLYNNNYNNNKDNIPTFCLSGIITDNIINKLNTPVQLINDVAKPLNDNEWTPYVLQKLPWTPLVPSYGLEQFSLPIPRRNAEQWRHFDVPGMISIDYSGIVNHNNNNNNNNENDNNIDTNAIKTHLINSGIWINNELCNSRLIYINGKFCETLSKSSNIACNLNSAHLDNNNISKYLQRITDGFTDELIYPVDVSINNEIKYETLLSKLSSPNHNVGLPTTQFAINTQQGTACFAALNTLKCQDVAYVHTKNINNNVNDEKPIVSIINVVTKHINNIDSNNNDDNNDENYGVSIHPRILVIGESNTTLSLIQNCIDMDYTNINENKLHTPKLINGYTQIFVEENANISHSYINEYGGDYYNGIDNNDNTISEEYNKNRNELKDTIFETIDVHVHGGNYENSNVALPTSGRVRLSTSITLLKDESICELNSLSIAGSGCKTDIKTNIHHIASNCISKQLQKNLIGGKLTTTNFRGRIRVEQSAQQTDSKQLSRTILLSDKQVRAWTVPSLEIIADDVKCTHGATVSDLSEEELFYLRSRGIDPISSRNILMYAFCEGIIQQIDNNSNNINIYDSNNNKDIPTLKQRISKRLNQLVTRSPRAIKGEYQSI